jgi:hypothetical protein
MSSVMSSVIVYQAPSGAAAKSVRRSCSVT